MSQLSDYAGLIVQAMPCTHQCLHCSVWGSPRKAVLSFERICTILEEWAKLSDCIGGLEVYFLDEPTNHPNFPEIFEQVAHLGLHGSNYLVTNGSRLADVDDSVWQYLIDAGLQDVQISLYGIGETHDRFVVHKGAFEQVLRTAQRAQQFGVFRNWTCYFGLWNIHEVTQMVEAIRGIEKQPHLDLTPTVMMFTSAGRGRMLERFRPTLEELEQLPKPFLSNLHPRRLRSEREWVELLLAGDEQAEKTVMEFNPRAFWLLIDSDLTVYAPGSVSGECIREGFRLGNLDEKGFLPMIQRLLKHRPMEPSRLEQVTWGELASWYGDTSNDKLYYLPFDLIPNVWTRKHLEKMKC